MKELKKKSSNKGFSLVELIVVVLIMAIIAVALAPQVMKWVDESRKSADKSTYDSVVACAQDALVDEGVWNECQPKASIVIKIDTTGTTVTGSGAKFDAEFAKQCGVVSTNVASIKLKKANATATITIVNGAVQRTQEPS